MSEAMEEIQRLNDELADAVREKENAEILLEKRGEEIERLKSQVLKDAEALSAGERVALELMKTTKRVEALEKEEVELHGELSEMRLRLEDKDRAIEEFDEKVAGLIEKVGELEDRESKLREAVALWKGKVDRGETWDNFERMVIDLLGSEGKDALKRLASFMRYTLGLKRRVDELEEKNLDLDLEAEHLASVIDAQNQTLTGHGEENGGEDVQG
jgi:hypothetical protein